VSTLFRNENLTDLKILVRFAFDNLNVSGQYDLKGSVGWWELDSKGLQVFLNTITHLKKCQFKMMNFL